LALWQATKQDIAMEQRKTLSDCSVHGVAITVIKYF
jgi:hypothetical protein